MTIQIEDGEKSVKGLLGIFEIFEEFCVLPV